MTPAPAPVAVPDADSLAARFQAALACHQKGQLTEAKVAYEAILQQVPNHFDARHLLGVVYLSLRQLPQAQQQIAQALTIQPGNSDACYNMGLVLDGLGQKEQAIDWYEQSVRANPGNFKAFNNKSKSCLDLGRLDEALNSCEAAIRLKPDYAEAYNNRGHVLLRRRDLGGALASFDQALTLRPAYAEAHANRAHTLRDMKQWDAALASYDQALALQPQDATVCDGRGLVLAALNLPQAALASHQRALQLRPQAPVSHRYCGDVLMALQRYPEAVAHYDQALVLQPGWAEVLVNRGNALFASKQFQAAYDNFEQAASLHPEWAEVHNNRGNALKELGRAQAAVDCYRTALAINPGLAEAQGNLGNALLELGRVDEALAQYDRVIALRPDLADSWWNKSLALLLKGDFAQGWPLYEWRWKSSVLSAQRRDFAQPLWLGAEDLHTKTILLHAEQGLGDTLQFCRYARLVADRGATVVLEAPKPLMALLQGLQGVHTLVEKGRPLPAFDLQTPLLSLPLAFKTRLETVPASLSYLQAPLRKRQAWAERLGPRTQPRVGLIWRGNPSHRNDHQRSVSLAQWLPYLPQGVDYVSLQKELREEDRAALAQAKSIRHWGSDLHDFCDTTALCELVDVVLSVDTSVAHLSAALGRPTWILLPRAPDWRWLLERTDSPWYPSARLYRQDAGGAWAPVLARLQHDLQVWLQSGAASQGMQEN